ncbi:MAG: hypothetical protein COZ06_25070 [Armatimonadetes bacterium CG_4_10_14_3_um_filter_66_18]|nr:hypothetical protein [Armatimonadota bacterium]OIP07923.1 MAG: hypothetical protein AUJ96_06645 [Armatimonadetes bacterium CG2_30_66_41]PIU95736.1 MAG: hypothetical protein COS65_00920 [Armatimonadetes bacterium CG06_land_8_20_14_3_00_66_21]PIX39019.1 MAG: hypothetical protein COZ57_29170 [Armatimonadetes bacterium CG_4_8_14_3_um_filter_66_20]PIY42546.1 MAG: hypothetical protein COZ06_25070 [Armatimonadetes bacterium CG_4_10_14_3_um_filter_66_18]PIZ49478.1 MAG: hypothetical protein COY42_03
MNGQTGLEARRVTITICAAALFVFGRAPLAGQTTGGPLSQKLTGDGSAPQAVAIIRHDPKEPARRLVLYRVDLPQPSLRDLERYYRTHPPGVHLGNVAFLLVDHPSGNESEGRVVWVAYVFESKLVMPPPIWSAALARDPRTARTYVVLVESAGQYARLDVSIWEVATTKSLAAYPCRLVTAEWEKWPKAPVPTAHVRTRGYVYGVSGISAAIEAHRVVIRGEKKYEGYPPAEFSYHLKDGKWSGLPKKWSALP